MSSSSEQGLCAQRTMGPYNSTLLRKHDALHADKNGSRVSQ